MGEKFEGERGCWNPKLPVLFSRYAKEITTPGEIKQKMPLIFVDGEIWIGRGRFYEGVTNLKDINWKWFRLIGFDNSEASHDEIPFEKRYQMLLEGVTINHSSYHISKNHVQR